MNNPEKVIDTITDYYYENGFVVFTEKFLLNRGWCCGNGCRHCPYKKQNDGRNSTKEDTSRDIQT